MLRLAQWRKGWRLSHRIACVCTCTHILSIHKHTHTHTHSHMLPTHQHVWLYHFLTCTHYRQCEHMLLDICTLYCVHNDTGARHTMYAIQPTAIQCMVEAILCTYMSCKTSLTTTYSVHDTMYSVQCTWYSVYCTLYTVHFIEYTARRARETLLILHIFRTVRRTLYVV